MALGPLAEEVVINRKLQGVDFLFKPLVSRCGDHHGRRVKAQHVRKRHRREHGESARGEKFFCLGTACAGLKKDDSLVVTFAGRGGSEILKQETETSSPVPQPLRASPTLPPNRFCYVHFAYN